MFLLSVAGYDPSGGAGILLDLKVFALFKLKGGAVPTALTIQSTSVFKGWKPVDLDYFETCLSLVFSDLPVEGVKIGMLATPDHVVILSDHLKKHRSKIKWIVLDPVLKATLNYPLFHSETFLSCIKEKLLPLVDVLCPNFKEAEILAETSTNSPEILADRLMNYPLKALVITGIEKNYRTGIFSCDYLFYRTNSRVIQKVVKKKKIKGDFHGTGCAFSSALLCFLIKGFSPEHSFKKAKNWLYLYLKKAEREKVGGKLWLFL